MGGKPTRTGVCANGVDIRVIGEWSLAASRQLKMPHIGTIDVHLSLDAEALGGGEPEF
jgi:hypothetical protein